MDFKDLSPELVEKMKACTSPEELMALAAEEDLDLSLDDLENMAGGCGECGFTGWDHGSGALSEWTYTGDTREDIEPALAREAYRKGEVAYAELDA